jgi:hypothetical protein
MDAQVLLLSAIAIFASVVAVVTAFIAVRRFSASGSGMVHAERRAEIAEAALQSAQATQRDLQRRLDTIAAEKEEIGRSQAQEAALVTERTPGVGRRARQALEIR